MAKNFKEIARIPVHLEKGEKYQVELVGNEVVVSKEEKEQEWIDVTENCHLEFKDSQHCSGRYIVIMYDGKEGQRQAAVIGAAGIQSQHGFRVIKAEGAFTSFKVCKKNK